jgi:hypothetical protein
MAAEARPTSQQPAQHIARKQQITDSSDVVRDVIPMDNPYVIAASFLFDAYVQNIQRTYLEVVDGVSELHHFLGPLNPDDDTVARYYAMVAEFNKQYAGKLLYGTALGTMNAPLLRLYFRKDGKILPINVLQAAVYASNLAGSDVVIRIAFFIAMFFSMNGFPVIRIKNETLEGGNIAFPLTAHEHVKFDGYSEQHYRLKFATESGERPSAERLQRLENIVRMLSYVFGVPIPMSHNLNGTVLAGYWQIYLNTRFVGMCNLKVQLFIKTITQLIPRLLSGCSVLKVANEYVWFDASVTDGVLVPENIIQGGGHNIDRGWIEPGADETAEEYQRNYDLAERTPEIDRLRELITRIRDMIDDLFQHEEYESDNRYSVAFMARYRDLKTRIIAMIDTETLGG